MVSVLHSGALEDPPLSTRPPPNLPSAARLEAASLLLAERGELRALVGLVERWAQLGDPTPQARLAEIDGFLKLCMMDRAWTRLKSMPADGPWHVEALVLTARMFIERGWPQRAQQVLDEITGLEPTHAALPTLREAAHASPRVAPAEAPDPGQPVEVQIGAVELFLATGAFLRAKRLLDQLQRHHPQHPRVNDLQWALQGDYELADDAMKEIVERCVPWATWAADDDFAGAPEPTDSVAFGAAASLGRYDAGKGNFPTLFAGEHGESDTYENTDPENTQTTRLRDLEAVSAARDLEDRDEDTQILRVVAGDTRAPPPASTPEEPIHTPGLADELEREDDIVVQITRRNERQPPHQTMVPTRVTQAPPRPLPLPKRRKASAAPPGVTEPVPQVASVEPIEDDDRTLWMLSIGLALLGVSGALVTLIAAWMGGFFGE